jgi:hypothetical protein
MIDERIEDAKSLRAFANDPNKTHLDKYFMCNLITRNKVFGHITQEQVDTLTVEQLADILEAV